MYKNENIVIRKVEPATFLVDITKCYNSTEETLTEINEIGCAIWNCINGNVTRQQILEAFLELLLDEKTDEFIEMVSNDVNSFVNLLLQQGCLIEKEDSL